MWRREASSDEPSQEGSLEGSSRESRGWDGEEEEDDDEEEEGWEEEEAEDAAVMASPPQRQYHI